LFHLLHINIKIYPVIRYNLTVVAAVAAASTKALRAAAAQSQVAGERLGSPKPEKHHPCNL
jgi:hypothetical protein